MFSVCAVPDRRPSLKRDQQPGHMEFSPWRVTTSSRSTVYFHESRIASQYLFPMVDYYNVVLLHLSSNSIALNFLFILATLQRRSGWTCLKCFELAASGKQLLSTATQHDVLCKMLRKHTATNRSSLSSAASRAASWITSRRNDA